MREGFDYIIVGGGAAGCVLANRLSARSVNRVLLLEAGIDTPPGQVPADILDPYPRSYANPRYRWSIEGHPLTAATSRAMPLLHGRVMGGGSSIMGMIMLRGTPADYDEWAASGADGWSWKDVLPYFRGLEHDLDFGGDLHGSNGPTEIRRHRAEDWPPIAKAARFYADRLGLRHIADMNADFDDGYGSLPIAGTTSRRASSATAYLTTEVRARPNLRIAAGMTVNKLLFEQRRVVGVCADGEGASHEFRARETILSMGALLTPNLLHRHGVGDPDALGAAGVPIRASLPGVGANLQNHAVVMALAHLRRGAVQRRPQRNHNNTMFRYSSSVAGCHASDMALALGSRASWHKVAQRVIHCGPLLMAPASRGRVSLGRDAKPLIEYNLLGDHRDAERLADGLRRAAALLTSPELATLIGTPTGASGFAKGARYSAETLANRLRTEAIAMAFDFIPGFGDWAVRSTGEPEHKLATLIGDPLRLADFVRRNVRPVAHHSGTCRMGRADDRMAVTDAEGRLRGLAGLRVVDASLMPTVPRGNTNLPVLMLAEKIAAAMIDRPAVLIADATA